MMNKVLDVCRYAINYSNEKGYGISNLKLQKVLYFIQAYFLIKESRPCFWERIEAWNFGPVVPKAYEEYRQYGACNIPPISSYVYFDSSNIWNCRRIPYCDNIICANDKVLIAAVVDMFADYSANDLVALTHSQSPWMDVYIPRMNNEIALGSIKEYFAGSR